MLRFEKQLYELREKIEELKQSEENSGNKMTDEVKHFEKLADAYADELYSNLTPLQKIQIARHPELMIERLLVVLLK
jgi:acetyl-CoA carboxylase carboxyl transferase subunit alpha